MRRPLDPSHSQRIHSLLLNPRLRSRPGTPRPPPHPPSRSVGHRSAPPLRDALPIWPVLAFRPETPLYEALEAFRSSRCHMAVVRASGEYTGPRDVLGDSVAAPQPARGIVTLEDILEELLQEEIEDETDRDGVVADIRGLVSIPPEKLNRYT